MKALTDFFSWAFHLPGWAYVCLAIMYAVWAMTRCSSAIVAALSELPDEIERARQHMDSGDFYEMKHDEARAHVEAKY